MPRLRLAAAALLAVSLAALLAAPAIAADDLALGADGTFYRAVADEHRQIFGGDDATRVLALEIETPDGVERHIVPGTDTWRPELEPRLVVDTEADAALLLWRAGTANGQASVFFAAFRDGGWSEIGQMRDGGDVVFLDAAPTVVVRHDRHALQLDDDTEITVSGVTFHVVWRQDGQTLYAPILFVDGEPVGWSETLNLSAVLQQAHQTQPPGAGGPTPDLFAVAPADDGRRLLVTFTEPTYGRLGTLAVGLLPLDLAYLGDTLRQRILDHADLYDPGDLSPFAEKIRGEIISTGHKSRTNPAVTHYLSSEIATWILDAGLDFGWDLVGLADAARSRAVDIGSSVYATTTADPHDPDGEVLQLDLGALLGDGGARDELTAVLDLEVRGDAPLPADLDGAMLDDAGLQTSADGRAVALVLEDDAQLTWTIHRGDGWSAPRSLPLGDTLDSTTARGLLRDSLR